MKILAVWVVYLGIMIGSAFGFHERDYIQIPVKMEIERAIEVKELKAPFVTVFSAQQLMDLVPKDKNIFVVFQQTDWQTLKKVYWALVDNGAGIIAYEDVYRHNGYMIEKYTSDTVYFYYDNLSGYYISPLAGFLVAFGIVGFIAAVILSVTFYEHP